jgi:hypothetical protein
MSPYGACVGGAGSDAVAQGRGRGSAGGAPAIISFGAAPPTRLARWLRSLRDERAELGCERFVNDGIGTVRLFLQLSLSGVLAWIFEVVVGLVLRS